MNILLPLYPTNATERALLPGTLRRAPFLRDLAALGGPPPHWRVLAVAADTELLDIVAASGVSCRNLDIEPDAESCGFLPCGTGAFFEQVLAEECAADSYWCVLDLSVPQPGAPTLEAVLKALRLYERETPLAVASVAEVDDHPAQLDAYYRLLDVELLALLEPDAKNSGWSRSAPQFVEWEAFGAAQPPASGAHCVLVPAADSWRIREEEFLPEGSVADADSVRLFSVGSGLARRMLPAAALRTESTRPVCAVPFFKPLAGGCCLLLRESPTEVGLYVRESTGGSEPVIRVWALGQRRLLPVPPLESEPDLAGERTQGDPPPVVRIGNTGFSGPILRFALPEGTDALAVAVLERASGEEVDFMEPLEAPLSEHGAFWHVDKATKQRTNGQTGKPITGRQDFYPLYEFDRALCLFQAGDFSRLADAAEQGRVAGLVISGPVGSEGDQ